MPKFFKSLFGQVLLALLLGVALGFAMPEFAVKLKPLGDGFIKLIKMIIPVLVFCVVVHGIAGAGDLKRVGRVGVKALVYFEVVTTIALVLGLVLCDFHQRHPWSEARWQFVLGRMRAVCEGIVVGDATVLRQQLGVAQLMTMQTYNPGYAQAIAHAGILAEPVTRQFDDPPSALPSFSRFWQRVTPKAKARK